MHQKAGMHPLNFRWLARVTQPFFAGQATIAALDEAGKAEARKSSPPSPLRDVIRYKEVFPVEAAVAAGTMPRHSEQSSKSLPKQHTEHLVSSTTRLLIQQQTKQQHMNDWPQHHVQLFLKHAEAEQKQEVRLEGSRASVSRATKASADEKSPPPAAAAPEQQLAASSMPAGHLKKVKQKHKHDAPAEISRPSLLQASKALGDEELHPKLGSSSTKELEFKVHSPRASVVMLQSAASTRLPSALSSVAPEQPLPASHASARSNFIEKKDAQSGRSYWVNVANKTTSWHAPEGWNASTEFPLARTSHATVFCWPSYDCST